jgi:hypothetical protein
MKTFKQLFEAKAKIFDEDGDPVEIVKETKGTIQVLAVGHADMMIFSIKKNLQNGINDYGRRKPDEGKYGVFVDAHPVKYADGQKVSAATRQWTESFWVKGLDLIQSEDGKWGLK